MRNFTDISQKAFDQAVFMRLTPEDASERLLGNTIFRTLRDKLLKYCDSEMTPDEMKRMLRMGLNQFHPDEHEQESIRVLLNRWFAVQYGVDSRTISRSYALEMCFILKLTPERANEFIADVTGEGIHYRNPEEFVAAYALQNALSYSDFLKLRDRALAQLAALPQKEHNPNVYTQLVAAALDQLWEDEALISHLCEHQEDFDVLHNTSYDRFTNMINVLTQEGTNATVSSLVELNLYRRFVEKKGHQLTPLERCIRAGWPSESMLSRMGKREINVTRKVLILLFLASGGNLSTQAQSEDDEWGDEPSEVYLDEDFWTMYDNMDALLVECGFSPLDPRHPFDWMVLFGIATGDLFQLDERVEKLLSELFGTNPQDEDDP